MPGGCSRPGFSGGRNDIGEILMSGADQAYSMRGGCRSPSPVSVFGSVADSTDESRARGREGRGRPVLYRGAGRGGSG